MCVASLPSLPLLLADVCLFDYLSSCGDALFGAGVGRCWNWEPEYQMAERVFEERVDL